MNRLLPSCLAVAITLSFPLSVLAVGFSGGGGAPTDATYITQTANGSLSAEQALGSLATGCMASTTTTGVVATRTITGTANQITVTNGDCSGNPTLSFPSTVNLSGATLGTTKQLTDNVVFINKFSTTDLCATTTGAIDAIGSTVTRLVINQAVTCSQSKTVPLTLTLEFTGQGTVTISAAQTLTINGPLVADLRQLFSGSGTVLFTGNLIASPVWWGFATGATDTVNAAALQAAINSNAPDVLMPPGLYSFNSGLSIDRVMKFRGSGSSGANGNTKGAPGASTTQLTYTGASGVAITLVGSGTEGKENIHLSDFSLIGTANADGGILVGSGVLITRSSLKNLYVASFSKTNVYGIKFQGALETIAENVSSRFNYDGWLFQGVNTTLTLANCYAGSNLRYGYNILNLSAGQFVANTIAEANNDAGLRLYGAGVIKLNFFGYYSEANNAVSGAAPLIIDGAVNAPIYINFFGANFTDAVAGKFAALGFAERVSFYNPTLTTYNSGFMSVTANTNLVDFYTWAEDVTPASVTGNYSQGVRIHSGTTPGRWIQSILNGGVVNSRFTGGLLLVTDQVANKSAIIALNGSRNVTTILSDPDSGFSTSSGTAGRVNIYYSGGYTVQNSTGVTTTLEFSALNIPAQ